MENISIFISQNYLVVFMLGLGLLLTQDQFPLLHLILGAKYILPKKAQELDKAIFIDVRGQDVFKEEHIVNAQHIDTLKKSRLLDAEVVLYGNTNSNYMRAILAVKKLGTTNVRILSGGFSAWKNANLPIK